MGFLAPKPRVNIIEPKAAPTMDDDAVRRAGEEAAQRASARRSSEDTNLTGSTRRRGGLGNAAHRAKVGG